MRMQISSHCKKRKKRERPVPDIHLKRMSPYSAAQMFDLVIDVDNYRNFIPYCKASHILSRNTAGNGDIILQADLAVAYKFLHETYRSEITAAADKSGLIVRQQKGPFRHLHNQWRFTPEGEGCIINFELQFDFAVPVLGRLLQPMMPRIVEKFITCFETRADIIYKK